MKVSNLHFLFCIFCRCKQKEYTNMFAHLVLRNNCLYSGIIIRIPWGTLEDFFCKKRKIIAMMNKEF